MPAPYNSFVPLSLLSFALVTRASPVEHVGPPLTLIDIRSSLGPTPVTNAQDAGNISAFNADFATLESQRILVKYAKATRYLKGIGLNPDTHPERGYPLFDPYSPVSDAGVASPPQTYHQSDEVSYDVASQQDIPGRAHSPLTDHISGTMDLLYTDAMKFGTPPQVLDIDIDTGSADLWVSVHCRTCSNDQLNERLSSTYRGSNDKCSMAYGKGDIAGTQAEDRVSVGSLTVPKQKFCAARKVSSDFDDEPTSGLLGLAFGSIATLGQPTFFENLLAEKKVISSVFSVHMTRRQETGSQICLGCFDPTKARGPIAWHSVVSRSYWSIAMNGFAVNTTHTVSMNLTAAIDTGSTLIFVPPEVAEQFYAQIPDSAEWMEGFYSYPCDAAFSVTLNFGGRWYSIDPTDFNLGRIMDEDSSRCVGGIASFADDFAPDFAIIGVAFLKSWYTVFDYAGRVGFAPSINNQ